MQRTFDGANGALFKPVGTHTHIYLCTPQCTVPGLRTPACACCTHQCSHANFSIAAAAELAACGAALMVVDRIGRHNTLALGMLLSAAGCLFAAAAPRGLPQALLSALGKFGCSAALAVANTYDSELFPTPIRCLGDGWPRCLPGYCL